MALGIEMLLTGKYKKKKRKARKAAREKTIKTKSSPADVIMLSSSRDDQLSVDTKDYGGVMSFAVVEAFRINPHPTYRELLVLCREILKNKCRQIPQLSSSHPMDMNQPFSL